MDKSKMCLIPYDKYGLPYWKYLLQCFYKCKSIIIPVEEFNISDMQMFPTINFHIHILVSHCAIHRKFNLEKNLHYVQSLQKQKQGSKCKL